MTRTRRWIPAIPWLAVVLVASLLITLGTWNAWFALAIDGSYVLLIFVSAAGYGAWPAKWLLGERVAAVQRACVAIALGLGVLATLLLILGVGAMLTFATAWALVVVGIALAALRALAAYQGATRTTSPVSTDETLSAGTVALHTLAALPLAIPLAILAIGACLPPGLLWPDEAGGYDVLEYHLQVPREYFDAGRIQFLPHNVYASFPQQVEILYLLLMHLKGDPHAAALPAQMLHGGLGVLAVAAIAAFTPPGRRRLAVVVLAAATPWIAYLGCLAYVENGVLFFAIVSGALLFRIVDATDEHSWRFALAAGACAGLAAGCKYTAAALVGAALLASWLLVARVPHGRRARLALVYSAAALLGASPWLVRNAAFTGNPVFPFAAEWLGGRNWSAKQAARWRAGHRVDAAHESVIARLALALQELSNWDPSAPPGRAQMRRVATTRFNLVLLVVACVALASAVASRRFSRAQAFAVIWVLLVMAVWTFGTHVPGRFASVVVAPLFLLIVVALPDRDDIGRFPALEMAAAVGALLGACSIASDWRARDSEWRRVTGDSLLTMVDRVETRRREDLLNQRLEGTRRAWLVGDAAVFWTTTPIHYSTAFNGDPWLDYAASATPRECIDWMRERGVSHVVFNWDEIERLRKTYGFSALATRDFAERLVQAGMTAVAQPLGIDDGRTVLAVP